MSMAPDHHQSADAEKRQVGSRRTVLLLAGIVTGMFAFGFALVPLYQVFCQVTGYNGSSQGRQADTAYQGEVQTERLLTVQFDATINSGLPWDFAPQVRSMQVHPGQVYEATYVAKNNAGKAIVAQAVPGITPWQATPHFHKLECFCFSQQTLQAGERMEMPLRFVVSPDLPAEIDTLTLSYTFMNTDRGAIQAAGEPMKTFPAPQAANNPRPLTMNTDTGGNLR